MRTQFLLYISCSLFTTIEAGKGHPVGYNYCTPGLTRPKQPKPKSYEAPPKPVGIDFPVGKPAPLPAGLGTPKALPKIVTKPDPVPVPTKPVPTPTPGSDPAKSKPTPKEPQPAVKPSPKNEPVSKGPPSDHPSPPQETPKKHNEKHNSKHSSKHQHKHKPPQSTNPPHTERCVEHVEPGPVTKPKDAPKPETNPVETLKPEPTGHSVPVDFTKSPNVAKSDGLSGIVELQGGLSGIATTTQYYDGSKGACGCGENGRMSSWQLGISTSLGMFYTAAASQALFSGTSTSWCGKGCGKCFRLTSAGAAPEGQGSGAPMGDSIFAVVTNLCPYGGNERWCPSVGQKNSYDREYHFDIMSQTAKFNSVHWDNPEVNFVEIGCPVEIVEKMHTCECGLVKKI